ncbi:hypothetical protein PRZ48_014380 [Zasmidium cellare]|uniref:Fungal N-terminal domain-containing protein n=1 Tax=Zasmidium cellare TaxID=395010 RepID=A0ABR0DY30_ZASCE|nr:hypothetical protein PRZ48_014380 [Zasmidium cellare]
MAELFGLVSAGAGLASLAFQLGESAVKARRLCKAIQGAPGNLQQLADEMETFSIVLREVADQAKAHDSGDTDILVQCVRMCERTVTPIKATVSKLDSLIHRHSRFGMLKAAVEDKELSKLCFDLERAKMSLGIALQLYSQCQRAKDRELLLANYKLASEQSRLLQTHFDSTITLRTDPSASPPPYSATVVTEISLDDPNVADRRRRHSNSRATQLRLRLKPWFISTIWDLCICKSFAGWDFRLRTMNVVPDDAEIFYRCRDGDLDGVRRMFQDGLASPHDQSPSGYHSVLKDAMRSRNMEICRFVVESLDIDVVDVDDFHQSLSHYAWTSRFAGDRLNDSGSVDMYRLLIDHMDLTEDTFLQGQWWEWSRNLECMKLAQNAMLTPYMDLPWQTRFEHAMELAISEGHFTAEMFLQSLAGDPFEHRLATSKTATGLTVSHALAMAAGSRTLAQLEIGSWVDLARGYIASDDGLHVCQRTPCETTRLRTWIHLLKSVGVDLTLYGQKEANSWQKTIDNRGHGGVYAHEQVVEKWSFGPEPEHWSLIFRKVSYAQVYVALAAPNVPGPKTST